jgi:hypothetical protein
MAFTIEREESPRKNAGNCNYRIFEDGQLVAFYWHDFRGDENGIEFLNGAKELWPVGGLTNFLEGGGPQPLVLSARAVNYLRQMLEKHGRAQA